MKKILAFAILFSGLFLAWACNDKNNNPTNPTNPPGGGGGIPTVTPTGTITPGTPTFTPTLAAGANTPTPTPTFSLPVPVFQTNYSTSAAPRCMVLDSTYLTVAENEVTVGGIVTEMEEYTGVGTASLNLYNAGGYPNIGNVVLTGCPPIPTPGGTPVPFQPTTIGLQQIQGFVNPGGNSPGAWSAVLDLTASGGASLYVGYYNSWNAPPDVMLNPYFMPFDGTSYGGIPFKNPKGICDDGTGSSANLYVADTGRGYVDDFSPYEGGCPNPALPIHQWNGSPGVTIGGTGVVFKSAAVSFKSPYAVTCDAAGNVWVGDAGYPSSYISEYTSKATTILESWQCITGCVVNGLAINSGTGNVYVADAGNNLVEVYSPTGTLLTEFGDPGPAAHEFAPFSPSCIAFSGGYIYVGDIGNDFIDVFQ